MPTYYSYSENNPSALQTPDTRRWESTDDWPRTYKYIPAYDGQYQGFHPPAPVYQGYQAQKPATYYYADNSGNPKSTAHHPNCYCYVAPQPATTGYYYYPTTHSSHNYNPRRRYNHIPYNSYNPFSKWYTYSNPYCYSAAQAATAATAATTANQPTYYIGATKAEIGAQNAATANNTGATIPTQLAPYKPAAGQQFWCKELDGSWTLRTHSDIMTGELSPGHWEMAKTGYHYWVRSN